MTTDPTRPDRDDEQPDLAELLRQLMGGQGSPGAAGGGQGVPDLSALGIDPATLGMVQAQLQAMFSGGAGTEGPVNVTMAREAARRAAAGDDPAVTGSTSRDVDQVVQVANLWLDATTAMPAPDGGAVALTRAAWVETTMPVWADALTPVARGVAEAMTAAMTRQLGGLGAGDLPEALGGMGLPPGMDPAQLMGGMTPMVERMAGSMFSAQLGRAVGALAGEVLTGTEVGLPLVPGERVAVLPANVAAFAEGLEVDPGEVHLYLAVREAARVRLFSEARWLAPQILAAVTAYATNIDIDTEGIEAAVSGLDLSDPQAMQEALGGRLVQPQESEGQKAALQRLETWLALVEGWVDHVTGLATEQHLPHAGALAETVRRRRAAGGPAEKLFSSLVGLQLRPRRLRDAANMWALLEQQAGSDARDAVWAHPDNAPTAVDLDDPIGFVERATGQRLTRPDAPEGTDAVTGDGADAAEASPDVDAELDKLLAGGFDDVSIDDDGIRHDRRAGGGPAEDDDAS